MCGIAGELRTDGSRADVDATLRMAATLAPGGQTGPAPGAAIRWLWLTAACPSSTCPGGVISR